MRAQERNSNRRQRRGTGLVVVLLLMAAAVSGASTFAFLVKDHIRTLGSLRRIPNAHMYVMDYYGDYHIEEIRRGGMDVHSIEDSCIRTLFPDVFLPVVSHFKRAFVPDEIRTVDAIDDHCSTVYLQSKKGNVFLGRNFDWYNDACLILRVHDPDGLASIAVLDLAYLNLNRDDLDQTNVIERIPLLFAPYYLMDGMNRHGVAVSTMSVQADPPRDPYKPAIIEPALMRLILDYAKDADEAVELARGYNVHFVDTSGSHLMVADARGRSRIVEYIDGKIVVTPAEHPWQVCTNHIVWNKTEQENDQRSSRYRTGSDMAEGLGGLVDYDDALQVTVSMAVKGFTMWTSVYDLTTREARFLYKFNLETEHRDKLPGESGIE